MLDLLVENSINNNNNNNNLITEGIDADFYQVIVTNILKDRIKSFIGHHIAEVQPFTQPSGLIFARKESHDSFEIIKKLVNVDTNKTIVKISQEAWEDLLNLSKLADKVDADLDTKTFKTPELFISWVKSSSALKETKKLLELLKQEAVQSTPLALSQGTDQANNAETNLFYITKKVNDLIIEMNSENFRTYDGFCILPQKCVGGILSLSFTYSRIDDSKDENRANDYFLGKINNVKFYLNPNKDETDAIVGLNSTKEKGVSSVIYSPYNMNLTTAIKYESGERTIGIFTRNAYTIHPLHSPSTPMLFKFEIQV